MKRPLRTVGITLRRGRVKGHRGRLYVNGAAVFSRRLTPGELYHLALVGKGETLTAWASADEGARGLVIGRPGLLRRLKTRVRRWRDAR